MQKILILGADGFIGCHLTQALLSTTDATVYGLDLSRDKLGAWAEHERMSFRQGDITRETDWIDEHIQKCDVVLPLVAIATPSLYVSDPLRVFHLDFEVNLDIIRRCVKYRKRVIFPSTSEVYGMCTDEGFDEETSNLVTGPICKQRWIYSSSKQLLDRVIYAYGIHEQLDYTLFRPFNWVGPKLDSLEAAKKGSTRVLTQFIGDIIHKQEIRLVDGGTQQRCFTDIRDGIDALMRIIANKDGCASGRIFNIGNPGNNYSIAALADMLLELMKSYPAFADYARRTKIITTDSKEHYGAHYQDVKLRVPAVENAKKHLGWEPKYGLEDSLRLTLDYFARQIG